MPETIFRETASSRPSLSGRLLLGLYLSVLVVMGLFAAWDYYVGWNTMLRQKRGALNEEATMLAEALQTFSDDPTDEVTREYIDRTCETMQHPAVWSTVNSSKLGSCHSATELGGYPGDAFPQRRCNFQILVRWLQLVLVPRNGGRPVGRAAPRLRVDHAGDRVGNANVDHPEMDQGYHHGQQRAFLPAVGAGGGSEDARRLALQRTVHPELGTLVEDAFHLRDHVAEPGG
ncbi:MAG: hypothetical protein ACOCTQ_02365 [Planctomycetota bacterium]